MRTLSGTTAGRSKRDELEHLQEELRNVRHQHEVLPGENAQLATRLAHLEEEVRALEQASGMARAEWNKPVSSLPEQLVTPFYATPSRKTLYGRLRSALPSAGQLLYFFFGLNALYIRTFFGNTTQAGRLRVALMLGLTLLWLLMLSSFQTHEDDDERLAWSFDDEGFHPVVSDKFRGKVLHSEVRKVEVIQGWLQRLLGTGSVRITWAPAKEGTMRTIDIPRLDAPGRLAEWLLARASEAGGKKTEGPHVG
jgi:hypothetical protein